MGVGADPLVDRPFGDDSAVRLDRMRTDDLDAVMEIERASFEQPWSRGMFVHELKIPFAGAIVARRPEPPNRLLGYACWWLVGEELQLLNLAVRADARRQGAGRSLFAAVLHAAGAGGARVISLEVSHKNTAAIAFYRRFGFSECGRRRNYYATGDDAILMNRPLSAESRRPETPAVDNPRPPD